MKPSFSPLWVLAAALLPVMAFAADAKPRKKAPAPGSGGGAAVEALKSFDKNENHQIDADELAAVQESFAALQKLDANSNGEIEPSEVERLKGAAARPERRGRGLTGLREADKNGNRKIDADEVAAVEKLLSGGRAMDRLDQNANGKLEPAEVERLNERIGRGFGGRKPDTTPPPPVLKTPEKLVVPPPPEESPKAEEKKESATPATPAPETKAPGNFGT